MWLVLTGALLPVMAQGGARWNDSGDWVEICTRTGTLWIHAETQAPASPSPDGSVHAEAMACVWCLLHGGGVALPPSGHGWSLGAVPLRLAIPLAQRSTPAHDQWSPGQSRAPPIT